jgi:hypothetical protein
VLEETTSVCGGDCRQPLTDRLNQGLFCPELAFSKQTLDLGEGFFDRIELWGVGRQIQ